MSPGIQDGESWGSLWWRQIIGPSRLVEALYIALDNAKHAWLVMPGHAQWQGLLPDILAERYLRYADIRVERFDGQAQDAPGALAKRLAAALLREDERYLAYRPFRDGDLANYLCAGRLLAGRVVWARSVGRGSASEWAALCRKYRPGETRGGLFVIEADCEPPNTFRGETLRLDDWVSEYDALMLCGLAASRLQPDSPQYAAALAQSLCGREVETAVSLLEREDFTGLDPSAFPAALAGAAPAAAVARAALSEAEAAYRVWRAQVAILLPLIERAAQSLIRKYEAEIRAVIVRNVAEMDSGANGWPILDYEQAPVRDIGQVQLGTLWFMNRYRGLGMAGDDAKLLDDLHEARNALAHADPCPAPLLGKVLGSSGAPEGR